MKQTVFFFLFLICFTAKSIGQNKIRFSVDAGTTFSQLPNWEKSPRTQAMLYSKDIPLPSPIIGTEIHYSLNKRVVFSTGIQYQQRGRITTERLESNAESAFLSRTNTQSRLHQIALPFSATAHFKIRDFNFNAHIGFRHVRTIGGYFNYAENLFQNGIEINRKELSDNLFNGATFYTSNTSDFNQTTFGLSFPIRSKWEIRTLFNYSTHLFSFSEKTSGWNCLPISQNIASNDGQIMIRYYLN
jgi:hypothetical protein